MSRGRLGRHAAFDGDQVPRQHGLADCLSGINRHLPSLVVRYTDALFESVHRGLEVPYRREPQKMIGSMRMIGELYNCEVLSSSLVYDTLYKIINTGHEGVCRGLVVITRRGTEDGRKRRK